MDEQPAPARTIPDIDTQADPIRRLNPAKICPDQQVRVVRRILTDLP